MAHRARKRFGQNFLVDRRAIERIVDALEPLEDGPVVEIGPGRGALTEPLLSRAPAGITAIEIDRDLAASLEDRFGSSGLELRVGDVRVAGVETDAQGGRVKMIHKGPDVGAWVAHVRGQHVLQGQPDARRLRLGPGPFELVAVDGVVVGSGEGRSRREAETHAAEAALERIDAQAAEAVTP